MNVEWVAFETVLVFHDLQISEHGGADGAVLVKRVRPAGGGKVAAAEWASEAGLKAGDKVGG